MVRGGEPLGSDQVVSVFTEETPEHSLPLLQVRTQKKVIDEPGRRLSTDIESAGSLTLESQAPELRETNVFCLSHQAYGIFVTGAQGD